MFFSLLAVPFMCLSGIAERVLFLNSTLSEGLPSAVCVWKVSILSPVPTDCDHNALPALFMRSPLWIFIQRCEKCKEAEK